MQLFFARIILLQSHENIDSTYRSHGSRKDRTQSPTGGTLRNMYHFRRFTTALCRFENRYGRPYPGTTATGTALLVGTLQLTDYYSAAQYEAEVLQLLEQLYTRHEVVLLTGGSMMYVDAVCKGIDDIPTVDAETRRLMLHKYETEGLEHLCAELKLLDPEYYKIVDLKNHKRVIHALEICYMTGKTYTSFRTQQKKERPFRIIKIGLTRDREELYARINQRVEQMITDGLVEEARNVYPHRALNSLNTVGYKEIFNYLDGEWTLPFAIEKIQQNSRIYSRKQMTWFKRDEEIRWFHPEQETEILAYLRSQLS